MSSPGSPTDLLTPAEAAEYVRVSVRTLQRAVGAGELVPSGTDGKRFYRRDDLDKWVRRWRRKR